MKQKSFTFTGHGSRELPASLWLPEETPLGVVLAVHGMTEHMGRYEKLAAQLTRQGLALAAFDLRGHGRNPGDRDCADLGEGGWEASLHDLRLFWGNLEGQYEDIPVFLLGFSLGSFLVREFLSRFEQKPAGVILLGTGQQGSGALSLLLPLVRRQESRCPEGGTTPLIQKLSFGTYNKKFAPNRTGADWLSSLPQQVDAYLEDPLCRRHISARLFRQLLESMKRLSSRDTGRSWYRDVPVLLLSGSSDPVGSMGKGVEKLARQLRACGIRTVDYWLYSGARHDLLHDTAGDKAIAAIGQWTLDVLESRRQQAPG